MTRQRWAHARDVVLVLVGGWGACLLALPEARRPALVLGVLGAIAVLAAAVTGFRLLGGLALVLCTLTPLMAGALEPAAARPARLLLASALLLVLVIGLDGAEREPRWVRNLAPGPRYVRVDPQPSTSLPLTGAVRRSTPPAVALVTAGAVAALSTAPAEPSVLLVLVGLLAGVGAVLLATRAH